jgi:transposase
MSENGIDSSYEIPSEIWTRIVPLLPQTKRNKKKTGRPRMDNRKAITAILYVLRTGDVSGKHYQELLAHQVQYMTDFKNGEEMVYLGECGLMV